VSANVSTANGRVPNIYWPDLAHIPPTWKMIAVPVFEPLRPPRM
jgi:hypothetical protein